MSDTFDNTQFQADSAQIGSGQMFPTDFSDDFSVIDFIARQAIADMETCTPVQIKAVHAGSGTPPAGGTVDVQLLLSLLDGNGKATKQGVVYGLPYFRMQSTNWGLILEPAVGDFGFIVCCSRDISNVVKTPGQANPGSFRTHSFSDGFFVPCSFNKAAPGGSVWLKTDGSLQLTTKDGVVIKSDGSGNLTITTQGNTTLNASGGAVDITATTTTFHGDVAVTGKVTANGEVTANNGASKVTLTQHRHSANNTPPTPGF